MKQISNVQLTDLAKKVGLVVNFEYHLLHLVNSKETIGHWSSAKGWVKQVTLHGNTADNDKVKEFRVLLLINDVNCRVTDKITITKDFR
ncbi:hypothetical protein SBP1_gp085 [Vibrio virus vB_VspP_SBP1]|uniref:Uncharacterized protein n=1 Tax=Vibrio virus vB_VspP_SBP1 TaxID=2500581 RepID=A0A3T0IIM0_9CAUD|nr:hypothetical protein KNU36_gp044 [Vibrio virus vB_VspP_SBP1]AZU99677.1 hypothetical protein SBP1_gp085 [Vibrio virus vB_VspP_SBP1]